MDGGACKFISRLNSDEEIADEEMDAWDAAHIETSLHDQMRDFYDCEVGVYNALKDLQGKHIPQVFASVTVPVSSQDASISKYIDVPGILMDYIDGFPLSDIADNAPRGKWQVLCDEAIRIIHAISERGILNEDVKTRSFIVQDVEGKDRVMMIDFALCKFRREYKDEEEWRKWKAKQDEEGAVGYVMQNRLKGGFVYTRSAMATQLDDDFMTEDYVYSCR
ncbi:hypothetical protein MW887_000972 [Aspergillus wentii]|nr:hypothetical protein MW887_000972 [Aspergillus wentii]